MNLDATLNEQAGPYAGMDRYEARTAMVRDLEELGYLAKIEPYQLPSASARAATPSSSR